MILGKILYLQKCIILLGNRSIMFSENEMMLKQIPKPNKKSKQQPLEKI